MAEKTLSEQARVYAATIERDHSNLPFRDDAIAKLLRLMADELDGRTSPGTGEDTHGDDTPANKDRMNERGFVTWASSEEDGGPDVGITIGLGDETGHLWLGEITQQRWESSGAEEISDSDMCWWLIHYPASADQEPIVLGRMMGAAYDAARVFFEETLSPLLRATALDRQAAPDEETVARALCLASPQAASSIEGKKPRYPTKEAYVDAHWKWWLQPARAALSVMPSAEEIRTKTSSGDDLTFTLEQVQFIREEVQAGRAEQREKDAVICDNLAVNHETAEQSLLALDEDYRAEMASAEREACEGCATAIREQKD